MHFFSPANVMKLLEVVRADATSGARPRARDGRRRARGKVPVLCAKSCFGFIGNRMLEDYAKEAHFLVEEGCAPAEVDGRSGARSASRWGRSRCPTSPATTSAGASASASDTARRPQAARQGTSAARCPTRSARPVTSGRRPAAAALLLRPREAARAAGVGRDRGHHRQAPRDERRRAARGSADGDEIVGARWGTGSENAGFQILEEESRCARSTSTSSTATGTAGRATAADRCTGRTARRPRPGVASCGRYHARFPAVQVLERLDRSCATWTLSLGLSLPGLGDGMEKRLPGPGHHRPRALIEQLPGTRRSRRPRLALSRRPA